MKVLKFLPLSILILALWSCEKEPLDSPGPDAQSAICGANLLLWKTDLTNSNVPVDLEVNTLAQPLPATANLTALGTVTDFVPERIMLSSNGAAYDAQEEVFYTIVSREKKLIWYQVADGQNRVVDLDEPFAGPLFFQQQLIALRILPSGYSQAPDASFEVVELDPNDGSILNTLVAGDFTLNSFFNHESISATTDGQGQAYFLSSTNLLIVDLVNGSFQHVDLYPDFDRQTNWTTFYGLEFHQADRLLAIQEINDDYELVEIDLSANDPVLTPLFDIDARLPAPNNSWVINREFYASAYDACEEKYYLTSLETLDANSSTRLIEIDWTNDQAQVQSMAGYLLGLTLVP